LLSQIKMIKVVVVDDQEDSIEKITFLLEKYCPNVILSGVAMTGKDGIVLINGLKPDLVLLDVEMDDMTGFEMLERLENFNFQVIFTTAFDQYAVKAIRASALDYLLKPIGKDDLINALSRVKTDDDKEKIKVEQISIANQSARNKKDKVERIALSTAEGLIFKNVQDIIYCESDRNYTHIFLVQKQKLLVTKTLKEIEDILDGSDFFRIHNSNLINMAHVERYVRSDGGYVIMSNGVNVKISRDKKESFLDFFSKF
jgi:two-component system, LytTR family, response regulator